MVSLTCDAWQAGNEDAYFSVTGHWVEDMPSGEWKQHSALLGFTQMNTAHDGIHLGRALYKIIKQLKIGHKVCFMHTTSYFLIRSTIGWLDYMRQCKK